MDTIGVLKGLGRKFQERPLRVQAEFVRSLRLQELSPTEAQNALHEILATNDRILDWLQNEGTETALKVGRHHRTLKGGGVFRKIRQTSENEGTSSGGGSD